MLELLPTRNSATSITFNTFGEIGVARDAVALAKFLNEIADSEFPLYPLGQINAWDAPVRIQQLVSVPENQLRGLLDNPIGSRVNFVESLDKTRKLIQLSNNLAASSKVLDGILLEKLAGLDFMTRSIDLFKANPLEAFGQVQKDAQDISQTSVDIVVDLMFSKTDLVQALKLGRFFGVVSAVLPYASCGASRLLGVRLFDFLSEAHEGLKDLKKYCASGKLQTNEKIVLEEGNSKGRIPSIRLYEFIGQCGNMLSIIDQRFPELAALTTLSWEKINWHPQAGSPTLRSLRGDSVKTVDTSDLPFHIDLHHTIKGAWRKAGNSLDTASTEFQSLMRNAGILTSTEIPVGHKLLKAAEIAEGADRNSRFPVSESEKRSNRQILYRTAGQLAPLIAAALEAERSGRDLSEKPWNVITDAVLLGAWHPVVEVAAPWIRQTIDGNLSHNSARPLEARLIIERVLRRAQLGDEKTDYDHLCTVAEKYTPQCSDRDVNQLCDRLFDQIFAPYPSSKAFSGNFMEKVSNDFILEANREKTDARLITERKIKMRNHWNISDFKEFTRALAEDWREHKVRADHRAGLFKVLLATYKNAACNLPHNDMRRDQYEKFQAKCDSCKIESNELLGLVTTVERALYETFR